MWSSPFLSKLLGLTSSESTRILQSQSLYASCVHQSNQKTFYKTGKIRRDFKSKHMLLSLHVWMVHKRLIHPSTSDSGKLIQESLFDRLWEDTLSRIRSQGLPELTVNSHLKNVQKYTFSSLMGFDHALTFESEEERLDELGGELWRKVFMRNEKLPVDHVLRLAKYVVEEKEMVMNLEEGLFERGEIPWAKPPEWRNVLSDDGSVFQDDETEEEFFNRQKDEIEKSGGVFIDDIDLEEGWKLALTDGGKVYYYHERTRESTWVKPERKKA